jgi:2-oxoglutarate ferredoxin oxidoreductase subunit beta
MVNRADFNGREEPTWCKGCGNYGILNALKMALAEQEIAPHQALIVTGIGCGSKLPHYATVNGLHTLHGRPVPVATGARLADHGRENALHILTVHGDGDGYGMGLGHFAHAARRNIGIVDVLQNNRIYGLTRGQYSPTSARGKRTPTSPEGALDGPVPPLALAITMGATFVARVYPAQLRHMVAVLGQALQHRGYALVDVLQPCVTFNRASAYDFYNSRIYMLEDADHDVTDKTAAWERALEWGDRIPIGVFYQTEDLPSYEEQLAPMGASVPLTADQISALQQEAM